MADDDGQVQVPANSAESWSEPGAPVFVLCNGRSGSTLLRFLLDAHPDLACPPETNLPAMAAQLATVWSLIEGAPLSAERGDEPPEIPDAAIAGVRRTMDEMTGSYLARHGKRRYCDKSLGTARYVPLLLRIYPEAKFLCLYRHPMDVIASGIEACPWGLSGYGFDAYIVGTPGNAVWALSRFWADSVSAGLAVEEQFPQSCHRIRYEDLVADPETVLAGIFEFLDVSPQPGISSACFSARRERFGPADYKIWHTSRITSDSVGRGWSVPVGMVPPEMLETMRKLTDRLDYLPVDGNWGTAAVPADLRVDSGTEAPAAATGPQPEPAALAGPMGDALRIGLARIDESFAQRWKPHTEEAFGLVTTAQPGAGARQDHLFRVDLASRSVTITAIRASAGAGADATDDTAWDLVGSAGAWEAVLAGRANLGVAMRRCDLRYCEGSESGALAAESRISMLAELLDLPGSAWSPAEPLLLSAAAARAAAP
jgi:hypothetical protein